MRSNYKQLGKYIKEVDLRNTNGKTDNLLGVSVQKYFMPSIANTIGTDFTTYKIVKKSQFTYIPDTSRRGEKIGIALLENIEEGLVSQAYTVFEIINHEELSPEYLMMWFKRPEFDRYARFKSNGSVREIFDWEEMCKVELPVPDINKQRELVKEYNTIVNRINLNNQLIQKLEETAQTIFKQWFVDFEFPDENGQPYKSSGGEMEWCEELGKEVPKGWRIDVLENYSTYSQGIQVELEDQLQYIKNGYARFLRIIDYTPNTIEPPRYIEIKDLNYFATVDDVILIRYGDAGKVCRRLEGFIANNLFKVSPKNGLTNNFLYYYLNDDYIQSKIRTADISVAMPAITHNTIKELPILCSAYLNKKILQFDKIAQFGENIILKKK